METMNQDNIVTTFKNLDDIRTRKEQLLTAINKDSNTMQTLWDGVFHKPATLSSPTSRFSGMMKTGAGILDVAILGWKLYRKFGGSKKKKVQKKSFFKFF